MRPIWSGCGLAALILCALQERLLRLRRLDLPGIEFVWGCRWLFHELERNAEFFYSQFNAAIKRSAGR
jgi:hypothetical protein